MKDLYFRYNPEPSKTLLERGQVVDGSYFLGDGHLHFGDNEIVECEFEVAHMQSGICWAVVYFPFSDETKSSIQERHQLENKVQTATKLTGKDRLFYRHVEVKLDMWIGQKGDLTSPGLRPVYIVKEYTVTADSEAETMPTLVVFGIANLPMSQNYSPKSILEQSRSQQIGIVEEAWKFALEQVVQDDTEKTPEELLKLGGEIAEQKIRKLSRDRSPLYRDITIKIIGQEIAWLQWRQSYKDRQYNLQPLVRLVVDLSKVPLGWNTQAVADWICALLSLALGRMIMWNHYYASPKNSNEFRIKQHWVSRTLSEHRFIAFTEKNGWFNVRLGLGENTQAIKLVIDVLENILKEPFDKTEHYLSALNDYVYYASTSGDDQHRCTLLCALVESVFSNWEENTITDIGKEMPKQHSRKIQKTAKTAIGAIIEEVLPKKASETDDEYKKRSKEFLDRVGNSIGNNLSKSFVYRLNALFVEQGWLVHMIDDRTKAFVLSRNELFHQHRFAYDDPSMPDDAVRRRKVEEEIVNIEMYVPLMLVTLLQYRDRYWDQVQKNWAWMPTLEIPEEQDT